MIKNHVAEALMPHATSAMPVGPALKATCSGVEETTTITPRIGGDVSYRQKVAKMRGYFADDAFFKYSLQGRKRSGLPEVTRWMR